MISPQNPLTIHESLVTFFLPSTYELIVQFATLPAVNRNSNALPVTHHFLYCRPEMIFVNFSMLKI